MSVPGKLVTLARAQTNVVGGPYNTVCGQQSSSVNITAQTVELTVPDCANGANGTKKLILHQGTDIEISGDFYALSDDAGAKAILTDAQSGVAWFYKYTVPGYGHWTGQFFVTATTLNSDINDAVRLNLTLKPFGTPVFVAG